MQNRIKDAGSEALRATVTHLVDDLKPAYADLQALDTAQALPLLTHERQRVVDVQAEGARDLELGSVYPQGGRIGVAGVLTQPRARLQLTLSAPDGARQVRRLELSADGAPPPVRGATPVAVAAHRWAGWRIARLEAETATYKNENAGTLPELRDAKRDELVNLDTDLRQLRQGVGFEQGLHLIVDLTYRVGYVERLLVPVLGPVDAGVGLERAGFGVFLDDEDAVVGHDDMIGPGRRAARASDRDQAEPTISPRIEEQPGDILGRGGGVRGVGGRVGQGHGSGL